MLNFSACWTATANAIVIFDIVCVLVPRNVCVLLNHIDIRMEIVKLGIDCVVLTSIVAQVSPR